MSQHADEPGCIEGYRVRVHRARKEHRCCACRETIPIGHRYAYESYIWDSAVYSNKRCLRCQYLYAYLENDRRAGVVGGDYIDPELDCGHSWEDTHEGEPPPEIARLAFMTRDEAQALPAEPAMTDYQMGRYVGKYRDWLRFYERWSRLQRGAP